MVGIQVHCLSLAMPTNHSINQPMVLKKETK